MRPERPAIQTYATAEQKRDSSLVTTTWRLLIDDGPAQGAWNMAVDRAIQLAHHAGESPPSLRLYEWARPTVTLGRFQDARSVDAAYCSANEIDIVRRPTGGRGVLHDDEVTYSVVTGVADGVPRGTSASYDMLCGGLSAAYRRLGVDADLTSRARGSRDSAACYLHTTRADLSLGSRKLSGSAQVWQGDTVLQHGSFTISRDVGREASVFRLSAEESARLAVQTMTLQTALGVAPTRNRVREAIIGGFAEKLGLELTCGRLSDSEVETARQLHSQWFEQGQLDSWALGST
jgi:lipoate-protein ligase A